MYIIKLRTYTLNKETYIGFKPYKNDKPLDWVQQPGIIALFSLLAFTEGHKLVVCEYRHIKHYFDTNIALF